MKIQRATLENCNLETDTVVAIDVLRAFTTETFAFAAGASEIVLVASVEDAFNLRKQLPDALIMGEAEGYPIEGFDLTNSPTALLGANLQGKRLIHRSTAGTQGVVRSKSAHHILAASLCCAQATAQALIRIAPQSITLIETGVHPGGWGDEDKACADYIENLLRDVPTNRDELISRVRNSKSGQFYVDPQDPVFPAQDLELALDIDRFNFTLQVQRERDLLIMRALNN